MMSFVALLSGIVFGLGIILSGMVNPALVLAFLDIAGKWDASLLWVMASAISVGIMTFSVAKKHTHSYFGFSIMLPTATRIDRRLLLGSFIFGIGWGLAGICPGPAMVLAGTGSAEAFIFLSAMLLGMGIFEATQTHQ